MSRLNDLIRFYEILGHLEARQQGPKTLNQCHARMGWPLRGVYFFFERGEVRSDSGNGLRIVRVGTHGVRFGAKATLWMRLSQHRGSTTSSGGNHRGSVFRLLVGAAIGARDPSLNVPSWGQRQSVPKSVRAAERELEAAVSHYVGVMPFLHLAVDDEPSPKSMRAYLERNSIALLSNLAGVAREVLDLPSDVWLGRFCPNRKVRQSGLWNQRHVDERYAPEFLDRLQELVYIWA